MNSISTTLGAKFLLKRVVMRRGGGGLGWGGAGGTRFQKKENRHPLTYIS